MLGIAVNALGVGWDGKAGLTLTDFLLVHCYSGGKLVPSVKYTLKQASENKHWSSGCASSDRAECPLLQSWDYGKFNRCHIVLYGKLMKFEHFAGKFVRCITRYLSFIFIIIVRGNNYLNFLTLFYVLPVHVSTSNVHT